MPSPCPLGSSRVLSGPLGSSRQADAFFCFTALMSEVRDHFCSNLDHTALGITARIERFAGLLAAKAALSLRSNPVISESE